MNRMKLLFKLPGTDSSAIGNVFFCDEPDGAVSLKYDYYYEVGKLKRGVLRFPRTRLFRFRCEPHCTEWHFEAFDCLMEVEDSEWASEILAVTQEPWDKQFKLRHFIIYFGDEGICFEFLADSWESLEDKL